eukprot:jgi/Ulvmu1/6452/UM003_0082.1
MRTEMLHLIIDQGNALFELARDVLHYILTPNGNSLDMEKYPPDDWPRPASDSNQSVAWLRLGFNFELVVEQVLGMDRPLTKYHGSHVVKLLQNHEQLRDAMQEPLAKPKVIRAFHCLIRDQGAIFVCSSGQLPQAATPPRKQARSGGACRQHQTVQSCSGFV